jgi:stage II sporulation protein P
MSEVVSDKNVVESILDFEMGRPIKAGNGVSLISLILDPSLYTDSRKAPEAAQTVSPPVLPSSPEPSATQAAAQPSVAPDAWLFFNSWNKTAVPDNPNVITKPAQETSPDSIAVNNKTDYTIDAAALLKDPLKLRLDEKKPAVLIIHTHSSEAYLQDDADPYYPSDPYRTQDKSRNISRIGDELAAAFENAGIQVIHDNGVYDYPSYEGAYSRSYVAIQSYLKKYPTIKIVIDVHRDAIESDDAVYKTIAQIGDTTCSQIKFVMGTNNSGQKHPNWKDNLRFALHIQQEMNKRYPSLAKPIELATLRYNQQATPGSMIVEVGCTGNTLKESLTAVRLFADAASTVLLGLYK